MPPGFDSATSFDDQPIRVNGQRVTPERGGQDLIYVPLTGQNSEAPFLLEIRYTIPGDPHQIDLPVFTDEPAVQKVYLCVYLPFERALLHKSGAWTDEAVDEHTRSIAGLLSATDPNSLASRMFRRRSENVDALLDWVQAGVNCETATNQKFEVDGRPYVFSALRPAAPPAGSLHLRTINMTLLNVIVFGVIGLLGLVLVRTRLTTQMAGALLVIAGLVFVGVFFPLVTEHLFGEALLLTTGVVALTWLVANLVRWYREIMKARRAIQASRTPAPVFATSAAAVPATESPDFTESPPPPSGSEPTETVGDEPGDSQ
jgi:hypothetical protein